MARCRFVQPDMVRIPISDGEWIEVKRRLTIGETRRAQASIIKEIRTDGRMTPNLEMIGKAQLLAYLLDWSLRDAQGRAVPIDTEARKSAALDQLDSDTYAEITAAIEAHVLAEEVARDEAKKSADGESASAATLPSVG